jgi:hypothetical protein
MFGDVEAGKSVFANQFVPCCACLFEKTYLVFRPSSVLSIFIYRTRFDADGQSRHRCPVSLKSKKGIPFGSSHSFMTREALFDDICLCY